MSVRHYIEYESKKFSRDTEQVIAQADEIIRSYDEQGYTLTLRQLYYQFVARALIENTERSYKRLGSIVTDARLAGLLPWDGIEDRTRGVRPWLIEEDEQEVLSGIERRFALDYWQRQGVYVEVWVEKEALGNVVERPCNLWRVPYMACKGYLSASEAWRAGLRFGEARRNGQTCHLLHLGDHDPSGIDMTRDNRDRMDLFSGFGRVEITRLALNMDQVRQYNPPPNPAKITDSRANGYIAEHGGESWELDALEPQVIDRLVTAAIKKLVNQKIWKATAVEETERRSTLVKLYEEWDLVKNFLETL